MMRKLLTISAISAISAFLVVACESNTTKFGDNTTNNKTDNVENNDTYIDPETYFKHWNPILVETQTQTKTFCENYTSGENQWKNEVISALYGLGTGANNSCETLVSANKKLYDEMDYSLKRQVFEFKKIAKNLDKKVYDDYFNDCKIARVVDMISSEQDYDAYGTHFNYVKFMLINGHNLGLNSYYTLRDDVGYTYEDIGLTTNDPIAIKYNLKDTKDFVAGLNRNTNLMCSIASRKFVVQNKGQGISQDMLEEEMRKQVVQSLGASLLVLNAMPTDSNDIDTVKNLIGEYFSNSKIKEFQDAGFTKNYVNELIKDLPLAIGLNYHNSNDLQNKLEPLLVANAKAEIKSLTKVEDLELYLKLYRLHKVTLRSVPADKAGDVKDALYKEFLKDYRLAQGSEDAEFNSNDEKIHKDLADHIVKRAVNSAEELTLRFAPKARAKAMAQALTDAGAKAEASAEPVKTLEEFDVQY